MSKVKVVNLNETPEIVELSPVAETPDEVQAEQVEQPPPTETLDGEAAEDIDTDEQETMLKDLKQIKKQNKQPAKKRVIKIKAVAPEEVEPEPIVEAPIVVEEPVAIQPKPRRKYTRKVLEVPEKAPEAETPRHERTAGVMIEEMQRAERALRYQMRKNKMQTLVSQAF